MALPMLIAAVMLTSLMRFSLDNRRRGGRTALRMLKLRAAAVAGLASVALALAGRSGGEERGDRGPPTVGYIVVSPSAVPISVSLGGRTVAYETSEVRPR